jgi:hypothetical protein
MSCCNTNCYNPCGSTCYRTNYNCCVPQQPCTQTVVNLPTTLTVTPTNSGALANNQFKLSLAGSGLSGNWTGGTTTGATASLVGGGGGTLCCCPCSIVTSIAGEAGTSSNNNIAAAPLTITLAGSSATGTGSLSGTVGGTAFVGGNVTFPSATVTCCNGIRTITLAVGTVTW